MVMEEVATYFPSMAIKILGVSQAQVYTRHKHDMLHKPIISIEPILGAPLGSFVHALGDSPTGSRHILLLCGMALGKTA